MIIAARRHIAFQYIHQYIKRVKRGAADVTVQRAVIGVAITCLWSQAADSGGLKDFGFFLDWLMLMILAMMPSQS